MFVGFGPPQELLSILKKVYATHNDVNKFPVDAREILVTWLEKMLDKYLISSKIVKYAFVLDHKLLVSQHLDVCNLLFQRLLFTLVHLKLYVHHKLI